jgi:subtilisin family serine protease
MIVAAGALAVGAQALTPNDPAATHPAYDALNLPSAWDITSGSPNVVIAIVDSGVEAAHPDLEDAVLPGYDFVARTSHGTPFDGHGTAVASVAAARAGNGIGGVGACFRCSILPLQVVGPGGIALNTNTADAIDYAVDHGAAVVNISLYGPNSPPDLATAVARARAAGVLVVAAAGNDASDRPAFPAGMPGAISVGASTGAGQLADFSNRGRWVRFAAPECAPIASLGGGSGVGCGTSVSSPLVSGVIALMRTQAPYATGAAIEESLAASARPVSGTLYGIPDAAAALRDLGTPEPTLQPVVFGKPATGETLEALTGIWSGAGVEVTYHWERCDTSACTAIPGATRPTSQPGVGDAGQRLRVVESARIGTSTSALTEPLESAPRVVVRPSIAGRPRIGNRLVARPGRWTGESLTLVVEWQRCAARCSTIGTGPTHRVRANEHGARYRLHVRAINSFGSSDAVSDRPRPAR